MNDHVHDLDAVREATGRLLATAARLDADSLAGPSLLPDWSRGHVLAHLSLNADALVNVLQDRPMYASGEIRNSDIERDSSRTPEDQLAELHASHDRFLAATDAPADWSRTVTLRNGVTDPAYRIPFRRLAEVELHHIDLGAGYELEDLPDEFTVREIEFLADRFSGNPTVVATTVTDDKGRTWTTGGGAAGDPVAVSGTAPELLGWLCGRRDGSGLTVSGGPLPALPPL
ncbi:MAG TPA: maleylpyruvate isomerase family mycothiol-dependent enzyme [Streptomyces sp.]|jgi:uncharacterized Actinobacterial protein TIGR03083